MIIQFPGATVSKPAIDAASVRASLKECDRLSQAALTEVANLARLALLDSSLNPSVAQALRMIVVLAEDAENDINVMAEEVGCNWHGESAA